MSQAGDKPIEFPLGTEGPFFQLQVALRLTRRDRPQNIRRVLVLIGITWLPLLLLWSWQPSIVAGESGRAASLLTHITTYARFFVTVPLLILSENAVRPYLERAFQHAVATEVVPPSGQKDFAELLLKALRWRESRVAEALLACLAFLAAQIAVGMARGVPVDSWIHTGTVLTPAGLWYAHVSLPLLQFLVFRWLYRLLIWWRVIFGLSRLPLAIKPAHPDQRGGLAFIGDSIQAFSMLAFAFSATAAGAVADYILSPDMPAYELKGFIGGAVIVILLLFVTPLLCFYFPAHDAKNLALLKYEGLAEHYLDYFDHKWLTPSRPWKMPERITEHDFSALADLNALVGGIREMKSVPITKAGLIPLMAAIVLPFLPVLVATVPAKDLVSGVLRVFFGGSE